MANDIQDQILAQVNSIWYFVRDEDGKEFTIKSYGHWSDIESPDGEKYSVKWVGGRGKRGGADYISVHGTGFSKLRRDGQDID